MLQCEDCNATITNTPAEIVAQNAGLLLCGECIDSYDLEDSYAETNCSWDPERQAFVVLTAPPVPTTTAQGSDQEGA